MFNVRNLSYYFVLLFAICVSCKTESETDKARALLDRAKSEASASSFDKTFALLDSLDKTYPQQIEIRREGMKFRAETMTTFLNKQLQDVDSIVAYTEAELQTLEPQFTHIEVPNADGYIVLKSGRLGNLLSTTGVEARINDADMSFYLVANSASDKIGINKITIHSGEESYDSATIPAGDARRGDLDKYGTDFATFAPSEVDSLGSWAWEHGKINSITITGSKGSKNIKPANGSSIGSTWRFAMLQRKLLHAKILRENIEKKLIVARDHNVNIQ